MFKNTLLLSICSGKIARMSDNKPSWNEFINGVKAELPILVGVVPFGMIYGVSAIQAHIPAEISQAMSSVVFAGSAQFAAAALISQNTPFLVILLTIFVLNIRHIFYSASLAPHLKDLPLRWKMGLAYLLTDEAYAATVTHFEEATHGIAGYKHWFLLGAGMTLWTGWQLSTAAGILLGLQVPPGWSLDFTLTLTFLAFLFSSVKDRSSALAALAAGVSALLFAAVPYKLGLVAATLVGVAAGMFLEGKK